MDEYDVRRNKDNKNETIGRLFLEKYLLYQFPTYKPVFDYLNQIHGIDFELYGKNKIHYICDLKVAASSYKRKFPLTTGCLECAARYKNKNGNWIDYTGWFLNDTMLSDTLVYLFIDEIKTTELTSPDDIKSAEVIFVYLSKIWEYLNNLGWNKTKLYNTVMNEYKNQEYKIFKSQYNNGIKFNSPQQYYENERPINILIPREIYKEISIYNKIFKL